MLELGFVRANLELVERKLRSRSGDAAAALSGFAEIDGARREAITRVETLKAERNRLSGEIGALRKSGGDAAELTEQVRMLKVESEGLGGACSPGGRAAA